MSESLARGRVPRPRHSSTGNGALLVLVDSSAPFHQRSIVSETILVALEHFGMPYRLLDLAVARPTPTELAGCAGVLLAQDGLAGRLSAAEAQLIADAVAEGLGLVSFDWDLRQCPGPLLEIFGFEGVERLPIASDLIRVPANDHYVSSLQRPGAVHKAQRLVTALVVRRWRADVHPLAEAVLGKDQLVAIRHLVPGNAFEPRHYPVIFAARWGRGKVVQYAINPRLWRRTALGHLGGLDDIFWRALVWTARKPFAANMIPPFVAMSFDDCLGAHDFRYLDICTRHGYIPYAAFFLDEIRETQAAQLRQRVLSGEIVIGTHACDYYHLQYYDFGVGEYSQEVLQKHFAREDEFYRRLGASPCRTIRSHWGELGVNALPFLKERGRDLICLPIHVGEHKADQYLGAAGEGYWPYDTTECLYDYLPDDNDFFIFSSFKGRQFLDFLAGATTYLLESPSNDIEKAAAQAAGAIRHGLDNGFYAELLTHEQKVALLSLDEWERILARTDELLGGRERLYASHDEIGSYLRSKDQSWLADVRSAPSGVALGVAGRAERVLRLSLFRDEDDGVERSTVHAPVFTGAIEVAS